jgi:Flp pilus assembly protein TadD
MARSFLLVGGPENAETYLRRGLERSPLDRALRYSFAATRLSFRDYASAMPLLEQLIDETPRDAQIADLLVESYLGANQLEKARAFFPRLLALRPATPTDLANLGITCEKLGDRPGAIDAYERCLALSPGFYQVHNQLGAVYAQAGDRASAERCFRRALEIRPDYAPARNNLSAMGLR